MKRIFCYTLAVATCAAMFGCGGLEGPPRRPTQPVSGKIVHQGKALAGARVVLWPNNDDPQHPFRPQGTTDNNGVFRLTTYVQHDGAPVGEYRVTVQHLAERKRTDDDSADSDLSIDLLRGRFAKVDSSGLSITVRQGVAELDPIQLR